MALSNDRLLTDIPLDRFNDLHGDVGPGQVSGFSCVVLTDTMIRCCAGKPNTRDGQESSQRLEAWEGRSKSVMGRSIDELLRSKSAFQPGGGR